MANPMTTSGDIIIGGSSGVATRLAAGTSGYVLTMASGVPAWQSAGAASSVTVGSTSIGSGTSGRLLYDNAGILGEVAVTGSGNAVLATAPTISNAIVGTQAAADNSTKAASTAYVASAWNTYDPGGSLNRIRNPFFSVQQRGTSGTITTGLSAYGPDGWIMSPTGATLSWSLVYNSNLAGWALRLSCATGMTALNLTHRIESYDAVKLLGYAKTLQPVLWQNAIYNNSGGSFAPQLTTGFASAQDNFTTVTADLAATNMQTVSNTTAAVTAYGFTPSITAAQMSNGYQAQIKFGGALNAASGYVDISLADLRAAAGLGTGTVASPPPAEIRNISEETAICQRYFCPLSSAYASVCGSTTSVIIPLFYPAAMRTASQTFSIPYTDGSYTSSGSPSSGQWNLQQAGVAAYTKTGTATITGQNVDQSRGFISITGATFSGIPNLLVAGTMANITVSAEL
jgi:hypothetical protein